MGPILSHQTHKFVKRQQIYSNFLLKPLKNEEYIGGIIYVWSDLHCQLNCPPHVTVQPLAIITFPWHVCKQISCLGLHRSCANPINSHLFPALQDISFEYWQLNWLS